MRQRFTRRILSATFSLRCPTLCVILHSSSQHLPAVKTTNGCQAARVMPPVTSTETERPRVLDTLAALGISRLLAAPSVEDEGEGVDEVSIRPKSKGKATLTDSTGSTIDESNLTRNRKEESDACERLLELLQAFQDEGSTPSIETLVMIIATGVRNQDVLNFVAVCAQVICENAKSKILQARGTGSKKVESLLLKWESRKDHKSEELRKLAVLNSRKELIRVLCEGLADMQI